MPSSGSSGRPDRRAGDHHVDRADFHLLDDVAFLAELVVREIVDANLVADARLQVRREVLIPHVVRGVFVGRHR